MLPLPLPVITGTDVAGVVAATGEGVSNFSVGQEVYGFAGVSGGAYAQYACIPSAHLAPKPQTLDFVEAAAMPLAAAVAWQALVDSGQLQAGQRVLVHGGAGGVGTFAIQLAHYKAARVVATAASHDAEFVQSLGADEVIDYRATRFETLNGNVDIVLDTQGGEVEQRSWGTLKRGGLLVSLLMPPSEEAAAKHGARGLMLMGNPTSEILQELGRLVDRGHLRPIVGKVLPLQHAQEAQTLKEFGHTRGKIVLKVA
jgi:NADPH:quinone reductase-like Zn-dependent oxidoreductase